MVRIKKTLLLAEPYKNAGLLVLHFDKKDDI